MLSRACIAAVAAALVLLLGPAAAQASHGFSVSKTEAAAGEEVEFQISGTQAGESYIVKVEDQEVASGFDNTGNGVSDKFEMPDFGSTSKAVSVEVDVTPLGGEPNHRGSLPQPMQYLAAPTSSPGQPAPQPAPIKTVADPVTAPEPQAATPPSDAGDKGTKKNEKTTGGDKNDGNETGKGGSGGSEVPTSSPTATSNDTGSSPPVDNESSSTGSDAGLGSAAPPGPTGPTSPIGSSIATALSPLSGIAEPGKTGFPILLIVLFVILVALALTAAGPRLWQRYEPALPWGPEVDDDIRLTALGRASASGAELQQTIAARKASRSTGRSSNGAGHVDVAEHSEPAREKSPTAGRL